MPKYQAIKYLLKIGCLLFKLSKHYCKTDKLEV